VLITVNYNQPFLIFLILAGFFYVFRKVKDIYYVNVYIKYESRTSKPSGGSKIENLSG
jgi:hypothetical protein